MFALPLVLLGSILQTPPPKPPLPKPKPKPPAQKLVSKDILVGTGRAVEIGDRVTVDYTGKFLDGKVFDSSKKPGREPFVFIDGMNQVIKGWDRGLIGMKVGGARKLTIPPDLAYGEAGRPGIPKNSTLVFTISLRKVEHIADELKITVTKPGTGPALTWGNVGLVKLTGKTSDGTIFVSTGDSLPYGAKLQVGTSPIPVGLTLGLIGMKKGEKRTITVPPDLAFGATGNDQLKVKPNETVTLEIELIQIGDSAPVHNRDQRQ